MPKQTVSEDLFAPLQKVVVSENLLEQREKLDPEVRAYIEKLEVEREMRGLGCYRTATGFISFREGRTFILVKPDKVDELAERLLTARENFDRLPLWVKKAE